MSRIATGECGLCHRTLYSPGPSDTLCEDCKESMERLKRKAQEYAETHPVTGGGVVDICESCHRPRTECGCAKDEWSDGPVTMGLRREVVAVRSQLAAERAARAAAERERDAMREVVEVAERVREYYVDSDILVPRCVLNLCDAVRKREREQDVAALAAAPATDAETGA